MIENQALLVHGGIPVKVKTIDDIAQAFDHSLDNNFLEEILWNDPSTVPGIQYSYKGLRYMFGVDIASRFLEENGLNVLIRGHESYDMGYHFHDDKILTLFSLNWM